MILSSGKFSRKKLFVVFMDQSKESISVKFYLVVWKKVSKQPNLIPSQISGCMVYTGNSGSVHVQCTCMYMHQE